MKKEWDANDRESEPMGKNFNADGRGCPQIGKEEF
jgi:hypothetical protein